jgi:hypothetical protein
MPSVSRDERSLRQIMAKLDRSGGELSCWPYMGCRRPSGYGLICRSGRTLSAHRELFRLINGPFSDDLDVLHTCDNPPCCNPTHLYLGTAVENAIDRVTRGRDRARKGERHQNSKLTDAAILEIRALRGVVSQRALALRFGVSQRAVNFAQHGQTWRHVTGIQGSA